jgi:hypothetical protein
MFRLGSEDRIAFPEATPDENMNGDDRAGLIKSEVPRSDVGEVVHATAVATAPPPPQAVQGYAVQGTVAEPPLMLPRPSAAGGMVTGGGGGQRPPHVYTQQPGVPIIIYAQDPAASNPYRDPPPSSHASLALPPQYPGGTGVGAGPPYGYWRDGICDCCSNLWPSCCCTCIFHGAWVAAQISQKLGYISFRIVLVAYFCIFIGTWFISGATNNALWLALPGGAVWLLGIGLRLRFVRHFAINTHGTVLEMCNAACCCCCSLVRPSRRLLHLARPPHLPPPAPFHQAQMSRHVMGYNKICDGDADPTPRDYYYAPAPGHGVVHPNV